MVSPITRFGLLDAIQPFCRGDAAALRYPQRGKLGIGWIYGEEDYKRAIDAFRAGTLLGETFNSINKQGVKYVIQSPERLGLVPHRDDMVRAFCIDLDDHTGDGGNVGDLESLKRFIGADPVVFTSRGGKGLHCVFILRKPMPISAFLGWLKGWGFNRSEMPEVFPKTDKLTQFWLPNEPNEQGGDTYVSGTLESCCVDALPDAPSRKLSIATLRFLMGMVRQPGRNDALNKAAFELRQKGVGRGEAEALCKQACRLCGLYAEEPEQCDTTFESGFSAGMSQAGSKKSVARDHGGLPGEIKFRRLDGIGNGERFVDACGGNVRYCFETESWFVWDETRWCTDRPDLIEWWAKLAARRIIQERDAAIENARAEGKSDDEIKVIKQAYDAHIASAARLKGVQDMLKLSQSEPGVRVRPDELDADPMLLGVENGAIDLRNGTLRPPCRDDLITKSTHVAFDPNARAPIWQQFLRRIMSEDDEMIAYMQRAAGYSLTGSTTEQVLFFLYGNGQNGKSVFVSMLSAILGDYASKMPCEMLMRSDRVSSASATPDVARLKGSRIAVFSELDEDQKFNESRVKDLTGSDRVVARPLYQEPFEFEPSHKLWIYGNHRPEITGTDYGIWRRLHVIHFRVLISEVERDNELLSKLRGEREGILAWCVQGCIEWQRLGLSPPESISLAVDLYRDQSDSVAMFFEQRCEMYDDAKVTKAEMYAAFCSWIREENAKSMSQKAFGQRLARLGVDESRSGETRYWEGVRLVQPGDGCR